MEYRKIVVDRPAPRVQRVTLNRPDKRNPLSNELRTELFHALETADADPELSVTIIRGAGPSFSAGYDLKSDVSRGQPFHTASGIGNWPRHVVDGFLRMWDLAKPVIAQVHGYCLAGGTELATACDLVYVAEDAKIGYPVVRSISPPDNQFYPWIVGMRRAMELMLTGDAMSGLEAVECGFANRAFPAEELDARVLEIAARVAKVPVDLQQFNKRAVHRQMEIMGIRAGIRAGTEMQALATYTRSAQATFEEMRKGLTQSLSKRDGEFGDYRTSGSGGAGGSDRAGGAGPSAS
jgi:enoyl-CoA hydratase